MPPAEAFQLLQAADNNWQQLHGRYEFLRRIVLTDVGNAVAWGLAGHPDDVEKVLEIAPTLDVLVRLVSGKPQTRQEALDLARAGRTATRNPPTWDECVDGILGTVVRAPSDTYSRVKFAMDLAEYVEKWGREDLANRIRRSQGLEVPSVGLEGDEAA